MATGSTGGEIRARGGSARCRRSTCPTSIAYSWRGRGAWEDGRSQQAPLVRDGILFLSNPGNVVQALNATDGTPLWEYRRQFQDGRSGASSAL